MKQRAFTLVELLVVVSLIALLAMLMAPSFGGAMHYYRDTQCKNNLKRISDGFILATSQTTLPKGVLALKPPGTEGMFPTGMMWPSVPANVIHDDHILLFKCPEDEIKQASVSGSLATVEYESEYGYYPMDTIGNGNCYKSRRGRDAKGTYTEYIMQDDEGTGGQYASMDFNGWIDTDGGCRIYDAGVIDVWGNIQTMTQGSVPTFAGAHGGYPTGINTCGNTNKIRYLGEPSLENNNGRMQDARGKSYQLMNWGEKMTNYAINASAYLYGAGSGCIVLVDYQETAADPNSPVDTEKKLIESARHFGRLNYLISDGTVSTASPLEISPRTQIKLWKPTP